ncbi:MAG: hypothetical protein HFI67_03080 [Lachnospiraceae bacterium]|nr:hypothetical protein [Lachnospiraceae bacterium]
MKKIKRLSALLLCLALLLATTACGTTSDVRPDASKDAGEAAKTTAASGESTPAEPEGENGSSDTINIMIPAEPVTLNALESQSNLDEYVFYLTSAMLYRSIDNELVPELCDAMEVSEDGTTYTYTLKEAKYSDGTAVTAADFVYYMVKRYLTSENCSQFVGGADTYNGGLDTCEGIYAEDDKTFVVRLAEPITTFDGRLEIYPVNQAYAEGKGESYGGTPADLQYSGPYILDDWTVGTSLTLRKNPDYISAAELFPLEHVNLYYSGDASSLYSRYASGDVDVVVSINDTVVEAFGEENCYRFSSGNIYGIEFNSTGFTYTDGDGFVSRGEEVTALMQNENFRKALCFALDREAICAAVSPSAEPTNRYVNSDIKGTGDTSYVEEFALSEVAPLSGDADAAKAYLAKALEELGYGDVSELPAIRFLTFENLQQKTMAETFVSQWKEILGLENIEINLQPIQSAIMSMVYMDYDLYLQQLTLNPDDMVELLSYWETAGSVSDAAGFQAGGAPAMMASIHADAEYDALVEGIYRNFDDASRLADMAKAEQMLYSSYVYFPIMAGGGYGISKDYVHDFVNPYVEGGYGLAHTTLDAH